MATFTASFRLRTPPVTGIARVAMGLALAGCSAWPPLPLDEGAVPPTLNATVVQEGDPGTLDSPKSESVSAAPKLAVSAGPVFCCNPFTVAFSVAAENVDASEVGTYRWEFGDGRSGEGADVEHTYPRPGVYTVMVTVQTASGQLIAGEHTLLLEWNDGVVDVVLDPPAGSLSSGTDSSPSDPTETVRPPDGGGGVVEPVDQPSLTLVVDAGPDLTVTAGERVRLDAGASRIPQDVPPTYTWSEISGFGIELIDGGTASPAFDAPAGLTDPIVLTFRLQIAAGTLEGADTVNVTVVPLEMPQVPAGGEPGYPMVFLDGPSENDPPGTYVVRWRFPGLSAPPADVRLIRDCCGCEDYESEPLFPDADGVYETTVEIPDDPSVWYQVEYTHGGIRYTSQSVYVNVPAGPASPPPMVIWYHYPDHGRAILEDVLRSGMITHVMLVGADRVGRSYNEPGVLEAIDVCRQAGVKVIWSRHLWNNYTELQTLEDVFDPAFYIDALTQIVTEAEALGADFTAVDGETYDGSPLYQYFREDLSEEDFAAMQAALEAAAEVVRVDFVYPAGSHFRPMRATNLYPILGGVRIAENTYFDMPNRNCRISYPYDVFGAFVSPLTERPSNPDAPYFLPQEILRRRYLWSAADGAPEGVNGLFLFHDIDEEETAIIARMIAEAFAGP